MKGSVRTVFTASAPSPGGHYTQAVIHEEIVYVSGILPVEPFSGRKIQGTMAEQTGRVLDNLNAILNASGSSPDRVLKVTVYLTDVSEWGEMNAVYAAFFGSHMPARTVVPVKELHYGFRIELDAIAAQ
jgi:2-iminobutanoate/2-iminopropanoate deaminase